MHDREKSEIATRLAAELRQTVLRAKAQIAECMQTIEWSGQPPERLAPVIQETVHRLESTVSQMDLPPRPLPELAPGEFWSLGCENIRFPVREIHGGYVEPILRRPLVREIPPNVVEFLIGLPWGDFLERERGGHIGWHYHYLNWKEERSNVVLCWDTRAQTEQQKRTHPMYHEKHGDGRYSFSARPDRWGTEKRSTMHEACFPDLEKWPLHEFRCASKDALLVWPAGASSMPIQNSKSSPAVALVKNPRRKKMRR